MYRLHDIEDIEGIGPARAAVLRRRGLFHAEDLLRYGVGALLRKVERIPGFPAGRIGEWRAHAALLQVEGLGPQVAEALCAVRRRGPASLASAHPREVVAELAQARAEGRLAEVPDEDTVLRWQKRAIAIEHAAKLAGIVTDDRQRPLAGAEVRVGSELAQTATDGRFWLPVVPHGPARIHLSAPGFRAFGSRVEVLPGAVPLRVFALSPGTSEAAAVDERQGGLLRRISPQDRRQWVPTEVTALPEGAVLWFSRRFEDGRAVLHGVLRRKVGGVIEIPKVVVPGEWVAPDAAPGTVLHWRGGRLEPSDESLVSLRMRQWLGPAARFFLATR